MCQSRKVNPVGLRILSLRGCTAVCFVKVGFEGSCGVVGLNKWEDLGLRHLEWSKGMLHAWSACVGFFSGVSCDVA